MNSKKPDLKNSVTPGKKLVMPTRDESFALNLEPSAELFSSGKKKARRPTPFEKFKEAILKKSKLGLSSCLASLNTPTSLAVACTFCTIFDWFAHLKLVLKREEIRENAVLSLDDEFYAFLVEKAFSGNTPLIDQRSHRLIDFSVQIAISNKALKCFTALLCTFNDPISTNLSSYFLWAQVKHHFDGEAFPLEWKKELIEFSLRTEDPTLTFLIIGDLIHNGDEESLSLVKKTPHYIQMLSRHDIGFQRLAIIALMHGRREDALFFFSKSKVAHPYGPSELIFCSVKSRNLILLEKVLDLYKPSQSEVEYLDFEFADLVDFLVQEDRKDLIEVYFDKRT